MKENYGNVCRIESVCNDEKLKEKKGISTFKGLGPAQTCFDSCDFNCTDTV